MNEYRKTRKKATDEKDEKNLSTYHQEASDKGNNGCLAFENESAFIKIMASGEEETRSDRGARIFELWRAVSAVMVRRPS